MWCTKSLGTRLLTLLSQQWELFPVREFSPDIEQCQPRRWEAAGKMKLFSFLYCARIALLCSTLLLKFLKLIIYLSPELNLFMNVCLIVDLCGKTEAGVSYTIISVEENYIQESKPVAQKTMESLETKI